MVSNISEIEEGIPIPTKRKDKLKYPFRAMKVNDSFALYIDDEENVEKIRNKIVTAARIYGQKHGMKFTIRRVVNEFRCWRIA